MIRIACRNALFLISVSAIGCSDSHVAGTSTTTGNTISARVLLSDGTPASGAKIAVRRTGFVPAGVPGSQADAFSIDTIADSAGFFEIEVPAGMRFFLSVYAGRSGDEAYWREDVAGTAALAGQVGEKDTLVLGKAGGVSGYVLVGAADSLWAGFPGTGRFTRPRADGYFALDSLPPGAHELRILRSNQGGVISLGVKGWTALPGATVSLDTFALPSDTAIRSISVPACLEKPDSVVFASKASGPTDRRRVFRTVMGTPPSEWIELDACLGQWTRLGTLPNPFKGTVELFAGPGGDYLIQPDSNRIWKRDSAGTRALPAYPESLALASFHGRRFYGFFHLDTAIRSFPDEADLLGKRYDQGFPRPAAFQRFAVGDDAIHYLIPDGGGFSLMRYEFQSASFHAAVPLSGFHGECVGMTAGTGSDVWLMDAAGSLYRVDGVSGAILSHPQVIAPEPMRGLAGP